MGCTLLEKEDCFVKANFKKRDCKHLRYIGYSFRCLTAKRRLFVKSDFLVE
ncbi:hypothetical protein HanPSC8_Chr16g0707551 [Helianthus annuus]|nr:hypothetical protein HanPSC8_Chr16g0707551 [Helianthus annuus]